MAEVRLEDGVPGLLLRSSMVAEVVVGDAEMIETRRVCAPR